MPRPRRRRRLAPRPPGDDPRAISERHELAKANMETFDNWPAHLRAFGRGSSDYAFMVDELIFGRGMSEEAVVRQLKRDKEYDHSVEEPSRKCRKRR